MASIIKIKRSSVQGKAPTTSNLDTGEIAINTRDNKIFVNDGSGIVELGANSAQASFGQATFANSNVTTVSNLGEWQFNGDLRIGSSKQIVLDSYSYSNQTQINHENSALNITQTNSSAKVKITGGAGLDLEGTANVDSLSIGNGAITFPTSDGTNGQVLVTNGTGTLTFQDQSGGGASANSFSVIEVGGTLVKATASTQRLSLDAGSNITLTPTDGNNTIVISSTGGGEVSNAYLTSTFTTNTDFQSYVSNTNPRITSLEARPFITTANDETIATASQTVVDSFSATAFRSAKYIVQVTHDDDNNRFQTSEVLLVHNGSAAFLTEYGSVATTGPIASIDADVSGGNVRLLVTPSHNNSTIETVRITVSV